MVMLRFTQGVATNAQNWVTREVRKYWKVNNNFDDWISVCLACVAYSCVFKKLTTQE